MKEEYLDVLDENGNPLDTPVKRSEAHQKGIWHRTISIFVINSCGEILIEQRSKHKDLFPGYYDIVGGHLKSGQNPLDAAVEEIYEEISLKIKKDQLEAISTDDEVIERVIIPEKGIINLERKTIYILKITGQHEDQIIHHATEQAALSPEELKVKGCMGEVSHIEFWSWEQLIKAFYSHSASVLASGIYSSLSIHSIRKKLEVYCKECRMESSKRFLIKYPFVSRYFDHEEGFTISLLNYFYDPPGKKANISTVYEIFRHGTNQMAGSYQMGQFRRRFLDNSFWKEKYNDPCEIYIDNLLESIAYNRNNEFRDYLKAVEPKIKQFVSDFMELPLSNGSRLRDSLSNLQDIEVARCAVLRWLENDSDIISREVLKYPTRTITKQCLELGKILFNDHKGKIPENGFERLHYLIKLGLSASKADFNNPYFQKTLREKDISENIRFSIQELSPKLGGMHFLSDFYQRYIKDEPVIDIVYLPGTAEQAIVSIAIVQEILDQNKHARIRFIPKSGFPGNDLSYHETVILMDSLDDYFRNLLVQYTGRFEILNNGPRIHGLDPANLDRDVAQAIAASDVIVAEGQAYAEIRGWKKPVFIAFRVNGRVAKAIHGDTAEGECGFVRLTPGVDHFISFSDEDNGIHETSSFILQTTVNYVKAILHENFKLIVKYIYRGNLEEAIKRIQIEAKKLKRTFTSIILGIMDELPGEKEIREFRQRHYPVFAIGGGGGFSAVTLRALKQLKIPTVAGVPCTDDGGSTGLLQNALKKERGFVFGVGDLAAILQDAMDNNGKQAILSFRFSENPPSMVEGVINRISDELLSSTSDIGTADDFLSFVSNQLNLARIIDERFLKGVSSILPLRDSSIRNLNVIAAFELFDALGNRKRINTRQQISALIILEKALALSPLILSIPVSFDECSLYLDYEKPVPRLIKKAYKDAYDGVNNRITGQKYIDKFPHNGGRKMTGIVSPIGKPPKSNREYIRLLKSSELIIMGAGSLISSQLSQLVIPGVIDVFLEAQDKRRILILNHVKMDETRQMTVTDHVRFIEKVVNKYCSVKLKNKLTSCNREIRISDIFTDIVVPRIIAKELEGEMKKIKYVWIKPDLAKFKDGTKRFPNKYVDFLNKNKDIIRKYHITDMEMEILSYLDQPEELYSHRSEKGRYRGALYATKKDFDYLLKQGIQLRNIHEVDSIGKNVKIVKSKGATRVEYFPGLIPESLMGIFRIALERGM
ncbi:MAG: YvcK family protein [Spirochaetales bacterium]|nr:YvcK family protein [Spirochaetales bacterium]